jgi:2-haloacid dehalogenase
MDASNELKQCKALLFDYFGTVVDWLTPVSKALAENAPPGSNIDWTEFAHKWRDEFFIYQAELADENSSSEVIPYNDVNDHALSRIQKGTNLQWTEEQRVNLINSWGQVIAWKDSVEGLRRLRKKYIVQVLHFAYSLHSLTSSLTVLSFPTDLLGN